MLRRIAYALFVEPWYWGPVAYATYLFTFTCLGAFAAYSVAQAVFQ